MNLTRTLAAFVISLAVTLIVGRFLIPFLRRVKAGQSIKRDGPVWHIITLMERTGYRTADKNASPCRMDNPRLMKRQ